MPAEDLPKWKALIDHHAKKTIGYLRRVASREELDEDDVINAVVLQLARMILTKDFETLREHKRL